MLIRSSLLKVLAAVSISLAVTPAAFAQSLVLVQGPSQDPFNADRNATQADSIIVDSTPTGASLAVSSLAPWLTFDAGCANLGSSPSLIPFVAAPATIQFCIAANPVPFSGDYIGIIEVTAAGFATLRVPIRLKNATGTLAITGPDPIQLNSSQLSGSVIVMNQTGSQDNQDPNANLPFTTSLGEPPPEGNWLSFRQDSRTTPSKVTITADPSQISPATANAYNHTIVFEDTQYHNKKTILVTLTAAAGDFVAKQALPQVAVGGGWSTTILIMNTNAQAASFTIALYGDNGSALSLPFTGSGTVSTITGSVPAQGVGRYEAPDDGGALRSGWALVTAPSGVNVQALFRRNVNGVYYEGAVPSSGGTTDFVMPFDSTTFAATGDDFFTGFAIANLDTSASGTVTCEARDENGQVIPNALPTQVLPPLGHFADYRFDNLKGKQGMFHCTSDRSVGALGLHVIGEKSFSTLSVFPK
jgi:hypothetical protein